MQLQQMNRAERLQGPTTLDDLTERVLDETPFHHDYYGIPLKGTHLEEDGLWRYNGAAGRLSRHSFGQLCSRVPLASGGTVPAGYLARCPAPLAAENLNHWIRSLPDDAPEVMVRTRDEGGGPALVRAVLSSRYAVADHLNLLEALRRVLPANRLSVSAWSFDDDQLTLRLLFDRDHPASLDDPLRVGVHISNSEVGTGRVSIQGLITRLVCTNGLVISTELGAVYRRHVGRAGESLKAIFAEGLPQVLQMTEAAAGRLVQLRESPAPQPIDQFMAKTAKEHDLPERIVERSVYSLTGETMYDVVNAFTRAAQSYPVAERLQVETAMGRLLDTKHSAN